MPSSGYGIVDLIGVDGQAEPHEYQKRVQFLKECFDIAQRHGMLVEWLESFVAAWQKTGDIYEAARAGLIEWDM